MEYKSYSMDLAGKTLTLEFGKYCGQANGSVWVHLGDTVVMVNATMAPTPREGVDFFPLAVDVEEKLSARFPVASSSAKAVPPTRPL